MGLARSAAMMNRLTETWFGYGKDVEEKEEEEVAMKKPRCIIHWRK